MRDWNVLLTITLLVLCLAHSRELRAQESEQVKRPETSARMPHRKTTAHKVRVATLYKPCGYSNVLTANLPAITLVGDNGCLAGGIGYERFMDKSGRYSLAVSMYGFQAVVSDFNPSITGFELLPAVLYHPQGNTKLLDYSAGMAIGGGRLRTDAYDRDGIIPRTVTQNNFGAVLGQFNLTLHHTNAFVLGFHLSAGAFSEQGRNADWLLQFGVKLGGRF